MKTLEELTNVDSASWAEVEKLIGEATNKVEVLPRLEERANEALVQLQQSVGSWVGAVVYHTGGILVDNGWIRILGSGCERFKRSLPDWNKGKTFDDIKEPSPYLLVADDVLGGFFAINGGGLGDDLGSMYYFAPDTLEWEEMELDYSQFLWFCFCGQLNDFYENFRWKGWEKDVAAVSADEAYHFYPPMYSEELISMEKVDKTVVSIEELFYLQMELAEQLNESDEEE